VTREEIFEVWALVKSQKEQALYRLKEGKNAVLLSEIREQIAYHLQCRDTNNSQKIAWSKE